MVLKVYGFGLSQPSRSLWLFCKVAKIPHEAKIVDLMKGENKSEAYLAINATGAVPAIVDEDGFSLTECMATLKYLAQKYKVADHWYTTKDLKLQAKVNQYLDWHHTSIRKAGCDVFIGVVFTPMFSGKPIDEEKLKKDMEAFDKSLGMVEKMFLGDKDYLASNEISIADICCMSEIVQVVAIQRTDVLANHPKLAAWKARVLKKLGSDYDDVFKFLFDFTASIKK